MIPCSLRFIRISDDRVVFKRGVHELLFEGREIASLAEHLLRLIDGTRNWDQVVAAFPGPLRPPVQQMLDDLLRRRMFDEDGQDDPTSAVPPSDAFYWNFGPQASKAATALAAARVLVVGVNRVGLAAARSLRELGVGGVTLVHDAVLDQLGADELPSDCDRDIPRLSHMAEARALSHYSIVAATSDFGETDALLEVNRASLAARCAYLPAWFSDLVGFVGPLNVPFETPCFQCFRLRRDANDPRYEITRAVRRHLTAEPSSPRSPGLLPPMWNILGAITALEIAKYVGRFAPSDTVGRLLELNLISFQSVVRRVLKVPRCPQCSDLTARSKKAITRGPKIRHDESVNASYSHD